MRNLTLFFKYAGALTFEKLCQEMILSACSARGNSSRCLLPLAVPSNRASEVPLLGVRSVSSETPPARARMMTHTEQSTAARKTGEQGG